MAKETALSCFLDTDRAFPFTILDATELIPVNVATFALSWMLKRNRYAPDSEALITKTTAAGGLVIAGLYSAVLASNLQVVTLTLLAANTQTLAAGRRFYELKRTDAGYETVLAYGAFTLLRSVHHGAGL